MIFIWKYSNKMGNSGNYGISNNKYGHHWYPISTQLYNLIVKNSEFYTPIRDTHLHQTILSKIHPRSYSTLKSLYNKGQVEICIFLTDKNSFNSGKYATPRYISLEFAIRYLQEYIKYINVSIVCTDEEWKTHTTWFRN